MHTSRIRRSRLAGLAAGVLLGCALIGSVRPALAQTPVWISGQAFLDHYQFSASDGGLHGFTYPRFRVTTDAKISDAFSARLRLDAEANSFGSKGPETFLDLIKVASFRDVGVRSNGPLGSDKGKYSLAAFFYKSTKGVRLTPDVLFDKDDEDTADAPGRFMARFDT